MLQQLYSALELADRLRVGKTPRSSLTRDRKVVRGLMRSVCLLEIIGEFRRHFVGAFAIVRYHLLGDSLIPMATATSEAPIDRRRSIHVV